MDAKVTIELKDFDHLRWCKKELTRLNREILSCFVQTGEINIDNLTRIAKEIYDNQD